MLQEMEQRPDRARAGADHARQQDEQQQTVAQFQLGVAAVCVLYVGVKEINKLSYSNAERRKAATTS